MLHTRQIPAHRQHEISQQRSSINFKRTEKMPVNGEVAVAKKHVGHPKINTCNSNTTLDELQDIYDSWAKDYDKETTADLGYVGYKASPRILHQYLKQRHENPLSLRILDVGAGTGLVAAELKQLGYENMDGLDASAEMLEIANKKNIYKSTFMAYIGVKSEDSSKLANGDSFHQIAKQEAGTPLPEKAYDATICNGCFTFGHVKGDGFDDLINMTKRGGLTCFSIRKCAWDDATLGYQVKIEQLIKANKWKLLSKTEEDYYRPQNDSFEPRNCFIFVFEILV